MKLTPHSSVFLNIVRGLSAQFVLVGHLLSFYGVYGYNADATEFIVQNFGVTIFFILSGFLISYSVSNKDASYGFKNFFIDRFSRIYVALFPALLVICVLDICSAYISDTYGYRRFVTIPLFVGNLLMLQDFPLTRYLSIFFGLPELHVTSFGSGRPLWTIAIEWWVYLFFGFLAYKKLTIRNSIFWGFLLVVPFYNIATGGSVLPLIWFCGVLIFFLFKARLKRIENPWKFILLIFIAAVARLYANKFEVYDLVFALLIALMFFFVLEMLQQQRFDFILKFRKSAELLAGYSFSLYLLHYSIAVFFMNLSLGWSKWVEMPIIFLASNLAAYLFATFTEFRYHEYRKVITDKFLVRRFPRSLKLESKNMGETKLG